MQRLRDVYIKCENESIKLTQNKNNSLKNRWGYSLKTEEINFTLIWQENVYKTKAQKLDEITALDSLCEAKT